MKGALIGILILLLLVVACDDSTVSRTDDPDDDAGADTDTDGDADTDADTDTDTDTGPWEPPEDSLVYVNTEEELYLVDPGGTNTLDLVAAFSGPCTSGSGFYDIAVSGEGEIVGIAAEGLYTVDPDTAVCSSICDFPSGSPHFFSLSYVKGADPAYPDEEQLVAASAEEGEWVMVDPSGSTVAEIFIHLGYHDPGTNQYVSSGDIVSIQVGADEFKTYATLKCADGYTEPGCESDFLAEVNPETGSASIIGATGFTRIFGLGFWGAQVHGFTGDNEYVLLDVSTGAGTVVDTYANLDFWGAGTTTKPYVVIE